MTLSIRTLSMIELTIMALSKIMLSIMTLSITTFSNVTWAEIICIFYLLSVIMLSAIMLSVVASNITLSKILFPLGGFIEKPKLMLLSNTEQTPVHKRAIFSLHRCQILVRIEMFYNVKRLEFDHKGPMTKLEKLAKDKQSS